MAEYPIMENVDARKTLQDYIALQQLRNLQANTRNEAVNRAAQIEAQKEAKAAELQQRFQELRARLEAQAEQGSENRSLREQIAAGQTEAARARVEEAKRASEERAAVQRQIAAQQAASQREAEITRKEEAIRKLGPAAGEPGLLEKIPLVGGLFTPAGAEVARPQAKRLLSDVERLRGNAPQAVDAMVSAPIENPSEEQYNALPKGAKYIYNGQEYTKE